jgi:hypothetical protein
MTPPTLQMSALKPNFSSNTSGAIKYGVPLMDSSILSDWALKASIRLLAPKSASFIAPSLLTNIFPPYTILVTKATVISGMKFAK